MNNSECPRGCNLTINCSSDRLQIWIGSDYHQLANRGLEMDFPPQLMQWMQEYPIDTICVINGPGSFTTLRVICLSINMYVSMNHNTRPVTLYHCTKTQLYHQLIPQSWSTRMAIYIGQRNNMRLYDFTTDEYVIMPRSDLPDAVMLDDVSDIYSDSSDRIQLWVEHDQISATRHGQTHTILIQDVMQQVDILHPHYLMQPNIQS